MPISHLSPEIRKARVARVEVNLVQDGKPLANREVTVRQVRHKFMFGGTGWDVIPLANGMLSGAAKDKAEQHMERFCDLFNQATLPFYWANFEKERGKPNTKAIMNAALWFKERGFVLKGHPLCWHTLAPDWLLPLSNEEIRRLQVDRTRRDMSDFAGVIDMWDVVNEAVIMPVFDKYDNGLTRLCKEMGRIPLLRLMFQTARETNPKATLLINDFDMSSAYDILIEGCLEAGLKFDVIGIQSHMHQGYWGVEKTLRILEHFERFNLPIHFTETNLVSGAIMPKEIEDLNDFKAKDWPSTPEGEERQARELVLHYETLFAHPLVEALNYWDFVDGGWLNAPAGLLRKDGSVKPGYEELHRRIKGDWWFGEEKMMTDAQGKIAFEGISGTYEATWEGGQAQFVVEK